MFRYFLILGLVSLHFCVVSAVALDVCAGYDPNAFDPNSAVFCDDPELLDNPKFEVGCSMLTEYEFLPPTHWQRIPHPQSRQTMECYAGLHTHFKPTANSKWEIVAPIEGDWFVLLSTGQFDHKQRGLQVSDADIKGAAISQEITLTSGDEISGHYFFGTTDYLSFNDYARITLFPKNSSGDPNTPILLAACDVATVSNYQSTKDWIPFVHIVEPNQVGDYVLKCEVVDFGDSIVPSYLAVDNFLLCRGGRSRADLNHDCKVNLEDYTIFSQAWLAFCPDMDVSDPNFPFDPNDVVIADPNIPCQLADMNDDWLVDANDLMYLSEEWLR